MNIAAISLVDSADLDIFVPACNVCRRDYRVKHRNKKQFEAEVFLTMDQ